MKFDKNLLGLDNEEREAVVFARMMAEPSRSLMDYFRDDVDGPVVKAVRMRRRAADVAKMLPRLEPQERSAEHIDIEEWHECRAIDVDVTNWRGVLHGEALYPVERWSDRWSEWHEHGGPGRAGRLLAEMAEAGVDISECRTPKATALAWLKWKTESCGAAVSP